MLNVEMKGQPICLIKEDNNKKGVVSLDDSARFPLKKLNLENNQYFQIIPDVTKERDVIYITGQSGSGKSYWISNYANEYKKMFPKKEIYLFSSLNEDKSIDSIKNLKRIKLSQELLDEDITAKDFENSLVIFDDCDVISIKQIKNKVISIMNSILECGRHYKISCIVVSHLACKGSETKTILNECHKIVLFPQSIGAANLKYLLNCYSSLDKNQQEKVKKLKSRWVCICKTYPNVICSEKDIYLSSEI
jgi:hypothetical protein